jgi:hypothetical protein
VRIEIEGRTYEWGDVHMGRCTLTHHGLNRECSPFLCKDLPGLDLDVRNARVSEEVAYRMCYPIAQARWRPSPEFPGDSVVGYYNQIISHTGYFAICGARGCIRSCAAGLEKRGCIGQKQFKTPVFPRPHWKLPPAEADRIGGVAEGRFPALFNEPDRKAGQWK